MADVLGELLARRGFARVQAGDDLAAAWRSAIGSTASGDLIAQHTRVGGIRRGVLEIRVAHSALVQELAFHKHDLLTALQTSSPEQQITDLKFKTGSMG